MNAPFAQPGADGLPQRLFTNAETRQMVRAGIFEEGERIELIRGVLSPMRSEDDLHGRARTRLWRAFRARSQANGSSPRISASILPTMSKCSLICMFFRTR